MNSRFALLVCLTALLVSGLGCSTTPASRRGYPAVDVSVEPAGVRLLRRGMTVCLIRTQLPHVEKWEINNRNTEIVVKSRGDRGPAAVELFDTQTGILKSKVMAHAIYGGQPAWAQGFEE